ncbi:Lrp/AsnC family transcriptional regulator, leucine-responsive regulatory protein [Cnuella takakiae]|uniref:Lrp/AsnC family transcriptional regulator, leucine-responsive regulatory protein n=1 Tax=Cnuella takakiae TaxID=1302690 RepID=A0A1M5BBG4_9BACT|nr:Lrp/AsnC family transcriptional regulator [Cnuella takakiae]OLY93419.1 AsnC family transcriptional regulator [Cnuella takakiae]SHF39849.1 Lrp/AsnC family transcriptional regulator, leucine-responsive regulatory protein [Cnuella takakiae]
MAKASETGEMPALDQTDLHILKLLQQNARMTIKEIAEQVHLSPTPVNERVRRMEASGVIRQYAAIVNAARLKKGLMTICYVSIKEHSKQAGSQFIQSIMAMDEVVECLTISGEFDFMLKVVSENMDAYYNFHVNKLGELENIGNVQSVFVMGVIKQTHQLVF